MKNKQGIEYATRRGLTMREEEEAIAKMGYGKNASPILVDNMAELRKPTKLTAWNLLALNLRP